MTETFDAAVLDLGLPKVPGLEVLKRWRAANRTMPVLILTARHAWTERVDGLNAGADDYMGKPFEMPELLARLRALVRRSTGRAAPRSSMVTCSSIPRPGSSPSRERPCR